MFALAAAALIGVLHVHHAPSHDSEAPFSDVVQAAYAAGLDFLVLTEHVLEDADGALPGAWRAGVYRGPGGRELLVMTGGEFGTLDGHLLGYQLPRALPTRGLDGAQAVAAIHELGGFAVVPHPFHYGGWHAWDAPFDGLEVHNHAVALRDSVGPLLPLRLLRLGFSRDAAMRARLDRPAPELARWDDLRRSGRRVVAFSGADVHQNVSLAGWQIDPYGEVFRAVRTLCPDGPLAEARIWRLLREGRCTIRYSIFDARETEAEAVELDTGRVELQLDGGRRVLEIRQFAD
ncbi:MAG: hypothetical protein JRG76_00180 [Deltaproteobacteria bacterium]|nr:hypothetical protein [Deltaproteobacteria bacterium]MBW2412896.1 hypothetical protein [Deltaproteobacteria bacterium]